MAARKLLSLGARNHDGANLPETTNRSGAAATLWNDKIERAGECGSIERVADNVAKLAHKRRPGSAGRRGNSRRVRDEMNPNQR